MSEVADRYRAAYVEMEQLVRLAMTLSMAAQGRPAATRGVEVGSRVFAKLACHGHAVLVLAPIGPTGRPAPPQEIWDVSSMAVLARAAIDSYFIFFYLTIDPATDGLRDFRFLVWDYHSENRRLGQLEEIRSKNPELVSLRKDVKRLREAVTAHAVYASLSPNLQKKVRKAELGILANNSTHCEQAGIDVGYYRACYKYLSSFVHAHPMSLTQLAQFRAGSDDSLLVLKVVLEYCAGFLAVGVRDLLGLDSALLEAADSGSMGVVERWSEILREFEGVPSAV